MNKQTSLLYKVFVAMLVLVGYTVSVNASNLPRSRQGTLVESTSATEVMVKSTGIGYWEKGMSKKKDIDKTLTISAELDARRAAIYFVLFGGTDPLLKTNDEKTKFEKSQEDFFDIISVSKYIAWEGQDFVSRIKKPIQKNKKYELHVEKIFKINKKLIVDYLVSQSIIIDRKSLVELIGLPQVMVLPVVKKGESPIDALKNNPNLTHAANTIQSFLTSRQYDVIVPEQQAELNNLTSAQFAIGDMAEDYSYQLALSIGSDVYITYNVNIENDKYGTKKAIVSIQAYETTTSRLLGTETGYSPSSSDPPMVLIENGVNDAIDKVLSRIIAYWKDDLERGLQYKLIVSISEDFNADQSEEISFVFSDILEEITKNKTYKENIVTSQTLDYLIWCDPERFDKPTKLYRQIKKSFANNFVDGSLTKNNLNRKMLTLKIEIN